MSQGILSLLAAGGEAATELAPTGYGLALVKMLGALVLVCALAYLALRLLRGQLTGRAGQGNLLRVVERCPLSPRQSLWVVEVGRRVFLLGTSEGAITRLAELERDALPPAPSAGRRSFAAILRGVRGEGPRQRPEPPPGGDEGGASPAGEKR